MSNILAFPSYSELFCIYTVEPRLTATSVIRSPRYHGHFFWPPGWTTIHFLWKRKKKFSLIWSPVDTAKFFWPIGDRINASSETQGQLVGSIKCSWWISISQKTFTTNILSTRLTAPGSPRMVLTGFYCIKNTSGKSARFVFAHDTHELLACQRSKEWAQGVIYLYQLSLRWIIVKHDVISD